MQSPFHKLFLKIKIFFVYEYYLIIFESLKTSFWSFLTKKGFLFHRFVQPHKFLKNILQNQSWKENKWNKGERLRNMSYVWEDLKLTGQPWLVPWDKYDSHESFDWIFVTLVLFSRSWFSISVFFMDLLDCRLNDILELGYIPLEYHVGGWWQRGLR